MNNQVVVCYKVIKLAFGAGWQGFPGGIEVKNPPANAGDIRDADLIPELGRSPRGEHSNPLHYSCLENSHGQRSLASYNSQGCKKLDTTEVT